MIHDEAPKGAQVVDLDAARSARQEARGDIPLPLAKVPGGYIELKPEVDVIATELLRVGKFTEALRLIVADPADVDQLIAGGFTAADVSELLTFLTGLDLGE